MVHNQQLTVAAMPTTASKLLALKSYRVPIRRKAFILVDTLGLLLNVVVLPADIQDRHAANDLLKPTRSRFPFVERIFADGGYSGAKTDAHRFVVLPKRRIVERTFAWISRNRRLMREFERYASTAAAFVRLAMIRTMLKRLTRPTACS